MTNDGFEEYIRKLEEWVESRPILGMVIPDLQDIASLDFLSEEQMIELSQRCKDKAQKQEAAIVLLNMVLADPNNSSEETIQKANQQRKVRTQTLNFWSSIHYYCFIRHQNRVMNEAKREAKMAGIVSDTPRVDSL